jgi:DNA (cytosine-5)-methyltransferase 1
MKYELLSLFCGAGGLDHGFSQAGFDTVLALDNCPDAVRTFNVNAKHAVAREADLSSLTPQAFLQLVPEGSHPIGLIGGPPCQGFSRANVCSDPSDPRNLLPFRYADLLAAANRKFKLHFFVFENVAGLATPKHAKRLSRILSRLRAAGFNVFVAELNASNFDVPQRRRRLFIVGLNATLYPKNIFVFPKHHGQKRTIRDAIAGLPQPLFYDRDLTPSSIPYHPNHWTMVPKSAKFSSGHSSDGRSFKRLQWDEVSPTVAYGHREIHVHPNGTRRLSVLEAMLLQGFSHEYTLAGSLSSQITQVSNAVPPPVAEAIARSLRSTMRGRKLPQRDNIADSTGLRKLAQA